MQTGIDAGYLSMETGPPFTSRLSKVVVVVVVVVVFWSESDFAVVLTLMLNVLDGKVQVCWTGQSTVQAGTTGDGNADSRCTGKLISAKRVVCELFWCKM